MLVFNPSVSVFSKVIPVSFPERSVNNGGCWGMGEVAVSFWPQVVSNRVLTNSEARGAFEDNDIENK
jgi:hypothetical protein